MVNKTNPIGVRFDLEKFEFLKQTTGLKTAQQIVNYLVDNYWLDLTVENKIKSSLPEKSAEFKRELNTLVIEKITANEYPEYKELEKQAQALVTPIDFDKINPVSKAPYKIKHLLPVDPESELGRVILAKQGNPDYPDFLAPSELSKEQILSQIKVLEAEKIPEERNTSNGRLVWKNQQRIKIQTLKNKL